MQIDTSSDQATDLRPAIGELLSCFKSRAQASRLSGISVSTLESISPDAPPSRRREPKLLHVRALEGGLLHCADTKGEAGES